MVITAGKIGVSHYLNLFLKGTPKFVHRDRDYRIFAANLDIYQLCGKSSYLRYSSSAVLLSLRSTMSMRGPFQMEGMQTTLTV